MSLSELNRIRGETNGNNENPFLSIFREILKRQRETESSAADDSHDADSIETEQGTKKGRRIMKDDSYAGAEEVAALEALRQEQHDDGQIFEYEKAAIKNEGMPNDALWGSDAASVRARRQARGAFAREDFESTPFNPVDAYTGPQTGAEVRNFDELCSFAKYREDLVREQHDDYDSIVNKYVLPHLEGVDRQELYRWLLQSDFAEKAYQYGLKEKNRLRNQLPTQEEIDRMSPEQFTERLEALRSEPVEVEEPEQSISRREMKRLNRIENPVDFGKALDAIKWRG